MIYYFSGTGNSRWAAETLAVATGDQAQNLIGLAPPDVQDQVVGLIFPVYAWGAPEPVTAFARQLQGTPLFSFAVATCGSEAGRALERLDQVFPLTSIYSLVMPNNYIFGSEPDNPETAARKISRAKERLTIISRQILYRKPVQSVFHGGMARLKSGPIHFFFERYARRTAPFHVTQACIRCGRCSDECPAKTIKMTSQGPCWGNRCYQCTHCINSCPVQAIQYGNATKNRRRYVFPGE